MSLAHQAHFRGDADILQRRSAAVRTQHAESELVGDLDMRNFENCREATNVHPASRGCFP